MLIVGLQCRSVGEDEMERVVQASPVSSLALWSFRVILCGKLLGDNSGTKSVPN